MADHCLDCLFGISVNALNSIYSVILKAALALIVGTIGQLKWTWFQTDRPLHDLHVFDSASRGVLGSLRLIWHVHIRQAVASFGAILTILLIAVDPFTQQLVHYSGCSEVVSSQTASYLEHASFRELAITNSAGSLTIPNAIQNAVNAGVFAPGAKVDIGCPTGNCTFAQEYGTVAYCTYCKDLSSLIRNHNTMLQWE